MKQASRSNTPSARTASAKRTKAAQPAKPAAAAARSSLLLSGYLAAWFKIIAVAMVSIVAFEAVAVSTAMPYVVEALHGEQYYALVSGIPLAAQLITTALAGPWCDAKGPKPPLYIGITAFIVGLLIATAAPTVTILTIGRGIQGLGGGLTLVPLYVMVGAYVREDKQPAFFAAFGMAWVVPSLVGPMIAGFFVEYLHWRFVFGICPLLYVVLAPIMIQKFKQFPQIHEPLPIKLPRTLILAALISGLLVASLQMISGTKPGDFSPLLMVVTLLISVALITTSRQLFPAGTYLARRGVPATVALRGLINAATVACEIYLVLMLKEVHGWGATQAGFVMTTGSITWALGSWVQGRLHDPQKRALLPYFGPALQLIGTLMTMTALLPHSTGWLVLLGWVVAGFGTGALYPATTVHALALTPPAQHGEVSSALTVADTLGAAALMAYGGIVYAIALGMGSAIAAFTAVLGMYAGFVAISMWVGTRARM